MLPASLVKALGSVVLVAVAVRVAWELLRPALVPMGVVLALLAILGVWIRGRRT